MSIYKIHLLFLYSYAYHIDISLYTIFSNFIQVHSKAFSLGNHVGTLSTRELLIL